MSYEDIQEFKNLVSVCCLSTQIYKVTRTFPKDEKFGLVSQMRRASVSVASNIAEGAGRSSDLEFKRFLEIAYGSLYELQTQLIISKNLEFVSEDESNTLEAEIDQLQKMIYSFSKRFK